MAALVAGGALAGAVLAGTLSASADDGTTSSSTSPSAAPTAEGAPSDHGDPSRPQRPDEELLTGSAAQRVEDAVRAEYPGATFVRIETDSDGVYEAHITTADGTPLTVELDEGFAITGEEQMGGLPGGSGSA